MERAASEDGKNIARGYRLDSQSIFSQLSQPLFTGRADVDRRQECGVARMSPFLINAKGSLAFRKRYEPWRFNAKKARLI
jgi:hypothetical protein